MSEVFCTDCSAMIGQYCRNAPSREKEAFVLVASLPFCEQRSHISRGQYMFRMSRLYLKDAQTSATIEPVYGYAGEMPLPPPHFRSNKSPYLSSSSSTRPSQTPAVGNRPARDSLGSARLQARKSVAPRRSPTLFAPNDDDQDDLLVRLAKLERQVSSQRVVLSELTILKNTISRQGKLIEQLRAEMDNKRQSVLGLTSPLPMQDTSGPSAAGNEVEQLREENRRLKARLSTIASAMGVVVEDAPVDDALELLPLDASNAEQTVLGKRKRALQPVIKATASKTKPMPKSSGGARTQREDCTSLPTPRSMQNHSDKHDTSFSSGISPNNTPQDELEPARHVPDNEDKEEDAGQSDSSESEQEHVVLPADELITKTISAGAEGEEATAVVEFSDDETTGIPLPSTKILNAFDINSPHEDQDNGQAKVKRRAPAKKKQAKGSVTVKRQRQNAADPVTGGPPSSMPQPLKSIEQPELQSGPPVKAKAKRARPSTKVKAPLSEITDQHKNKQPGYSPGQEHAKPTSTIVIRDSEEVEEAQENEVTMPVKPKPRQRKSDIEKRDRMAQAALEMEMGDAF